MALPEPAPARRRDLVIFDLTAGFPTALGVLRRRLGPMQLMRLMASYAALSLRDPLEGVSASGQRPEAQELGFDVGACRFVELCEELGRAHLARMFCAADSIFFERGESPVRLERQGTLARGASRCDFRFHFRGD